MLLFFSDYLEQVFLSKILHPKTNYSSVVCLRLICIFISALSSSA